MSYFLWRISSNELQADYFCRLLTAASIFMPITAYHFSIVLFSRKANRMLRYGYIGAFLLCLMLPSGLILQGVSPKFNHRYWPDAGPLTWLYLTYFFGYLLMCAWVFLSEWKQHLGIHAAGNLFLLFTWIAGCLGGITNFPLWFGIPVQPYGNVFIGFFLIFLSQALYSNFFTVRFQIYKKFFYIILCMSAALVYVLFITYYFNTKNTPLSSDSIWIHAIGAFLVIVIISWTVSFIKNSVEKILAAVFLSEPTSDLIELKELPNQFAEFNDQQSLLNFVANALKKNVPTRNSAIFKKEIVGGDFRMIAKHGQFPASEPLRNIASNDPLVESFVQNPRCLVIDKISKNLDSSVYQSLLDLRNAVNLSLLIPIFSNQQLYGLILLGPLKAKQHWGDETTAILFNLGAQIGLHFRTIELEGIVDLRSTELEQRTQQLEKAHQQKRNFLTSFNHEIRNPLNGIINISQLLAEEKGLTDTQSELIKYLVSCKQHLEQLIIPTLDYNSLEAGIYNYSEESFDVNVVLKSIVAMHTHQAAVKGLQIKAPATSVQNTWIGAVTPLRQILINLVSNAIKYTSKGSVSLQMSYQQLEGNITATFSIIDSGTGIPISQQQEIFQPLTRLAEHRNSQPGSGMGLSISRRIAQVLQGELYLQSSSPEVGTVFKLTLPFKLGATIAEDAHSTRTKLVLSKKMVLLADDMDFNRYAYRILLERMGAKVKEAKDGAEALQKLQSSNFDLAILDISMPLMDGTQVIQKYLSSPVVKPPVFIAFSAQTDSVFTTKVLSAGFQHFIGKPLTIDKLRALFHSNEFKNPPAQGNLLNYLGGDDAAKITQLKDRYRQSFSQGLAEITQLIERRELSKLGDCVHKLRGLACLQNNTIEMKALDEMAVLIAANALPHEYTQLLDELNTFLTDDAVSCRK